MATRPIPIRLDERLLARIDRVVVGLSQRAHGVGITRSAVVRAALERGLEHLEAVLRKQPVKPKRRSRAEPAGGDDGPQR
jgi:hypothetical protein